MSYRSRSRSHDSEGGGFFDGGSGGGGGCLRPVGVTRVVLGQGGLGDALQHLLGEDSQQLPADVQRLKDGSVLVVTWGES